MFRWGYTDDNKYKHLLSLVAHEYFHLWNVKRLRPIELGPFDYEKENYTTMLWIAEGFTAYFDDLIMKRAGYYSDTEYLAIVSSTINKVQNQYGHKVMALSESSFNSWIKTYLTNENSNNVGISYYQKGMLVALILDLEILQLSNGSRRLDDVMRSLYNDFYLKENKGFTEQEFISSLSKIADQDLGLLVYDLVHTTKDPDYSKYFSYVGLVLKNQNGNPAKAYLGIGSKEENGRTIITTVELGSPASKAGLSAQDEIIAVNNYRVSGPVTEILKRSKPGESLQILVSRGGQLREFKVVLDKSTELNYALSQKEKQEPTTLKMLNLWLGADQ
jgi:predicted metalloprotease with PDZ domain